jgi:hypothetical protein
LPVIAFMAACTLMKGRAEVSGIRVSPRVRSIRDDAVYTCKRSAGVSCCRQPYRRRGEI